ncbi:MAG: branched-chain-amino-acid transaminase [Gemmatimonadetes bacterium]|nr:branched-chain-amino-acid transaminase [Gemmatimonadota bacterium]
MAHIWMNGVWGDRTTAKISVYDHGLLYGDGIFEGIRAYNGRVFRLKEHLDRLYDSAKAIALTIPMAAAEMGRLIDEGVTMSGLKDAYIRPIVTRGDGDMGIDPKKCAVPTIVIIVDSIKMWAADRYENGLTMVTAGTPIPHKEALCPRIKSLNYLPHVLAKHEANTAGADDAVMLDSAGHVCEATGMNVWCIRDGVIKTPPPSAGILLGVTRGVIFELASAAGYAAREEMLNRYDLYTADEVFLCGTGAEVAPVRQIDGRPIGDGKPGPITRDLIRRFRALTRGD